MYGFPPYVSVAKQRANAEKAIRKLRKSGFNPSPVEAFDGKIAHSPWGKKWCDNLEAYADQANRLGRGKRYVRAGSVCSLDFSRGAINALVNGSSLYKVTVRIEPLRPELWEELQKAMAGKVGSVAGLVMGKVPPEVMELVSRPRTGLFPSLDEISFSCSCPDYAGMCKHVAATLYGIGRRLDEDPALLFRLRSVDPRDLARFDLPLEDAASPGLEVESLGDIFGIDMDLSEPPPPAPALAAPAVAPARESGRKPEPAPPKKKQLRQPPRDAAKAMTKKTARRKTRAAPIPRAANLPQPVVPSLDYDHPTGAGIKNLREKTGMDVKEFAKMLRVPEATVKSWEKADWPVLSEDSITRLREAHRRLLLEKLGFDAD